MIVRHEDAQWSFFRNTLGAWQWTRCNQRGSETKVSYHVFSSLQQCLDDAVVHGLPRKIAVRAGNAGSKDSDAAHTSRIDT
jgi:hypothetical protein